MAFCSSCGVDNPTRAKFCLECGAPVEAAAPERFRRTVTILFSDVVGSTALGERLDPETLARVLGEYFEAVKPVVERHGGTLAKFIGDAVMAVFGLTKLHEDDALRAARAAVEMRETLARLNPELERRYGVALATRTGINTGPVAGEGFVPDKNFVAGDTANTAARLQTAAGENEILLGQTVYRLIRDTVEAELLPPLQAKGKSAPLTVFRLVAILAEEQRTARRLETPLVARQNELAELEGALRQCVESGGCRIVTVVGAPGVGKSRLVREFVARVEPQARVLTGRCLPYGQGITYWPLAQMVRQAAAIEEADSVARAVGKLQAVAPSGPVAERIAEAIGLASADLGGRETPWAFRRLFEAIAEERPLVCVCDDLQWAEDGLVELLEYLSSHVESAPVLLCCLARPELLEVRPEWPGVVRLDSLAGADSDLLLTTLLGEATLPVRIRERIGEAADGNPLFIEQLASMLVDDGLLAGSASRPGERLDLGALPVPPTIQALLAARLDRLEPSELHVVTRAAVIGQVFYRGALDELVAEPARLGLDRVLLALARKDFVVPSRSDVGGEEAFAFRHLMIRDAAYEALTKEDRADLHERFASWFERAFAERLDEVEEILGYHLERAYLLRAELRPVDDHGRALASRAAERLAASGIRARVRADVVGAASLLGRAAELLAADDPARPGLLVRLADALVGCARFAEADAALSEALTTTSHERTRQLALLRRYGVQFRTDPGFDCAETDAEARRVAHHYAAAGDDEVAAAAWDVVAMTSMGLNRFAAVSEAGKQVAAHLQRAGDPLWVGGLVDQFHGAFHGTEPTSSSIALGERTLEALSGHRGHEAGVLASLATLHAMRGELETARELALRGRSMFEELGMYLAHYVTVESIGWYLERLSGDWEAAERELRRGYEALAALNETGVLASAAGYLAHCMVAQGRDGEADEFIAACVASAPRDDVIAQTLWREARAKLLAQRGEAVEAELLAAEATSLARPTDSLELQGDVLFHLAEVLHLIGKPEQARAAADEARSVYERKEYLVGAGRARELRAQIDAGIPVSTET